jgi:ABC-type nitrate/sulfonate/bicarbonate transport system permease component
MKKISLDTKTKKIIGNVVYPVLSLVLVLAVWWIVSAVKDKPLVFPTPDKVVVDFFNLFGGANFWKAVGMTVARTVICFLISAMLASDAATTLMPAPAKETLDVDANSYTISALPFFSHSESISRRESFLSS